MQTPLLVRKAEWPADARPAAGLLRNYAGFLESGPNGTEHICAAGLYEEIATLRERYGEPGNVLLLAWADEEAAGCCAVKRLDERPGAFELKRLWTEPAFRGLGAGRSLVTAAIAWAAGHGGDVLLLDTQPRAMPQAVALYRSLGFTETARYNGNPVSGLLFLELRLH